MSCISHVVLSRAGESPTEKDHHCKAGNSLEFWLRAKSIAVQRAHLDVAVIVLLRAVGSKSKGSHLLQRIHLYLEGLSVFVEGSCSVTAMYRIFAGTSLLQQWLTWWPRQALPSSMLLHSKQTQSISELCMVLLSRGSLPILFLLKDQNCFSSTCGKKIDGWQWIDEQSHSAVSGYRTKLLFLKRKGVICVLKVGRNAKLGSQLLILRPLWLKVAVCMFEPRTL